MVKIFKHSGRSVNLKQCFREQRYLLNRKEFGVQRGRETTNDSVRNHRNPKDDDYVVTESTR